MRVHEFFTSIQGEGLDAGRLCAFVRFTACNLRCTYCDTEYAFYEGDDCTQDEILERVLESGAPLVCLTGGEPMLQKEIRPLMTRLLEAGVEIVLETGGSLPLTDLPQGVVKVMDVKTPGAFRGDRPHAEFAVSKKFLRTHLHYPNLELLGPRDQVKFVLCDRDDYDWALSFIKEHDLVAKTAAVLMSPVHPGLAAETLAGWVVEDKMPVRLNLQLHKYIWGAEAQGV